MTIILFLGVIFIGISFLSNNFNDKAVILTSGSICIVLCYLLSTLKSNIFNVKYDDEGVWISKKMYDELSKNTKVLDENQLKKKEAELLKKVESKQSSMEDFENEFFMIALPHVEERFCRKSQNDEKKILLPWNEIENWKFTQVRGPDGPGAVSMKSIMFSRRFYTNYNFKYFDKYLKTKQLGRNALLEVLSSVPYILGSMVMGVIMSFIICYSIF